MEAFEFADLTYRVSEEDTVATSSSAIDTGAAVAGVSEVAAPGGLVFLNDLDMSASASIGSIDTALATIASKRADFGAVMNRLAHQVSWLSSQITKTKVARGQIMNADMSDAAAQLSVAQIKQQAAFAATAQANVSNNVAATLLSSLPLNR